MNPERLARLHELARAHGVQLSYADMRGQQQPASPEMLSATLNSMGVPASGDKEIAESLKQAQARRWIQGIEPVVVAWDRKPFSIDVRVPTRLRGKAIRCVLRLEGGQEKVTSLNLRSASSETVRVNGVGYFTAQLPLPALPFGYHHLELELGNRRVRSLLISAPTKSYSKPGVREWGIFLPLYAAHSKESWGAGNFSDWEKLCAWTASHGSKLGGTLPLLAAFLDQPACDPSPYSPASRLFWNEFYLDIPRVPEFASCPEAQKLAGSIAFQKRLADFRKNPLIDYQSQWAVRRSILEILARFFFDRASARRSAFEQFLTNRPEVEDYARFRAVCDGQKTSWRNWPKRLRDGELREGDFDPKTKGFHLYVQWLAQEQMDQLVARSRESRCEFYLDLPLGVHPDSYDIWRERNHFALAANVGAPPDHFFTQGQNWGFSPLHPQRIRELGYRHVIQFLQFQMRHTQRLRIDHVMGLHRLYWISQGFAPTQGVYVNYPAEELHAILSLESHRHRTTLVGENLGTVPPEVNAGMHRHGLSEMFVLQFEQQPDPDSALRTPPAQSVASLNTHDTPTFAAHLQALDISEQRKLGLIPKAQLQAKRAGRRKSNQALAAFLRRQGFLKADSNASRIRNACLAWLARSPAEVVLVNLEDLLGETQPQNMPGTYKERPNWRRKTRLSLEQIFASQDIQRVLKRLSKERNRPR